jgi:hypothetical protein
METTLENLQYPIGRFTSPADVSEADLALAVRTIAAFPDKISHTVAGLSKGQIDTPYRPEGWTIRQVVHHCADSHMNAYIRLKLALTEDNPTIKPYDQSRWAMLIDSKMLPAEVSLNLIRNIHLRWVTILESLSNDDWNRSYVHPEHEQLQVLKKATMMYAWHCEHHLAHITSLVERMGWNAVKA